MSIIFVARYQAPSDQARAQYNNYNYQPQQQQQPPRQARALYNAGNEGGKELLTEFVNPFFFSLKDVVLDCLNLSLYLTLLI